MDTVIKQQPIGTQRLDFLWFERAAKWSGINV